MSNLISRRKLEFLANFLRDVLKAWTDGDGFLKSNIPPAEKHISKALTRELSDIAFQSLQRFWSIVKSLKEHDLKEIQQAVKDYDQYVIPACPWLHDTPVHRIVGRLRFIISASQTLSDRIAELLESLTVQEFPESFTEQLVAVQERLKRADLSLDSFEGIAKALSKLQAELSKHLSEIQTGEEGSWNVPIEVIVVEDDEIWLRNIATIVQDELGLKTHHARSAEELVGILKRIARRRADEGSYTHISVILDLGLPKDQAQLAKGDTPHTVGEELLKALRDFKPNADVIVLTSLSHLLSVQRLAAQLGVNPHDYILKDQNWERDLRDSLKRLDQRVNVQGLIPRCVELIGEGQEAGKWIVRIDDITVELEQWLYPIFAVLFRHGRKRGLTEGDVMRLVKEEYGRSYRGITDAIYRLRKEVHQAFQGVERYIDPHRLIRTISGFKEEIYKVPESVTVIDREFGEAEMEWEIEIIPSERIVLINGRKVNLEPVEFEIFTVLARSRYRALSGNQISSLANCPEESVYYHIRQIQQKIARGLSVAPQKIEGMLRIVTLPSWENGYRLDANSVTWHGSEIRKSIAEFSILVVEDDPLWRERLCQTLQDYGYKVFDADSIEKAVEVANIVHPTVLCLDLELPEKSGGEQRLIDGGLKVLKRVSEFIPDVGAIVVTIHAEHGELRNAVLTSGVRTCDFLQKGEPNWEDKLIYSVHRIKRELETASLIPANIPEQVPDFQGIICLSRKRPREMVLVIGSEEITVNFSKTRARLIWALAEAKGEPVAKDELIEAVYGSDRPEDAEGALKSLANDTRKDIEKALQSHGKRIKVESILMTVPDGYQLAGTVRIE